MAQLELYTLRKGHPRALRVLIIASFMVPGCFRTLWRSRRHSRPPSNGGVAQISNADDHFPASTAVDILVPAPVSTDITTRPPSLQGNAEDPAPALTRTVGIPTLTASSETTYHLTPSQAKKNVGRIRRFRILVMGRANAGKTTILRRVCNTTDEPEIFDAEGGKVNANVVQGSVMRGYHNIEDELIFGSNPNFVFHDSCGFEAGSEAQFQKMKGFVMHHATTSKLEKRIHAIWFCIPLNESHRMVTAAERKFFEECDTGHVPVIVVLTKADALELDAWEELMDRGLSVDEALEGVAKVESEMVQRHLTKVKKWLEASRFPPHDFQLLKGMQDDGADCTDLIKCTTNALNEEGLQKLLISTQQSSLVLCIEYAVMKALRKCMECQFGFQEPTKLGAVLSTWFPYADGFYG